MLTPDPSRLQADQAPAHIARAAPGRSVSSLPGQAAQQLPGEIERLLNAPALTALIDEAVFEVVREREVAAVPIGERGLTDDRNEPSQVSAARKCSVELVSHGAMVFAGLSGSDAGVHEPTQGGQDVDRRVNAASLELPRQHDLSFGDVSGQVGDRMGD